MELWTLMWHSSYVGWMNAQGHLLGGYYTDIESACRSLRDDPMIAAEVVSIEYTNGGEKALITTKNGEMYGAYKDRVPMREDVPTTW